MRPPPGPLQEGALPRSSTGSENDEEAPPPNKACKGTMICQVFNCGVDLSSQKSYFQRYRVCEEHLKLLSINVGGKASRFCQQCGRFQEITEFDGNKRSCRARLQQHNARRRKRPGRVETHSRKAAGPASRAKAARGESSETSAMREVTSEDTETGPTADGLERQLAAGSHIPLDLDMHDLDLDDLDMESAQIFMSCLSSPLDGVRSPCTSSHPNSHTPMPAPGTTRISRTVSTGSRPTVLHRYSPQPLQPLPHLPELPELPSHHEAELKQRQPAWQSCFSTMPAGGLAPFTTSSPAGEAQQQQPLQAAQVARLRSVGSLPHLTCLTLASPGPTLPPAVQPDHTTACTWPSSMLTNTLPQQQPQWQQTMQQPQQQQEWHRPDAALGVAPEPSSYSSRALMLGPLDDIFLDNSAPINLGSWGHNVQDPARLEDAAHDNTCSPYLGQFDLPQTVQQQEQRHVRQPMLHQPLRQARHAQQQHDQQRATPYFDLDTCMDFGEELFNSGRPSYLGAAPTSTASRYASTVSLSPRVGSNNSGSSSATAWQWPAPSSAGAGLADGRGNAAGPLPLVAPAVSHANAGQESANYARSMLAGGGANTQYRSSSHLTTVRVQVAEAMPGALPPDFGERVRLALGSAGEVVDATLRPSYCSASQIGGTTTAQVQAARPTVTTAFGSKAKTGGGVGVGGGHSQGMLGAAPAHSLSKGAGFGGSHSDAWLAASDLLDSAAAGNSWL